MFQQSYNIGKKGEHYVIDIFNNCGFKAEINNVYETRYDYDIIVNMEGIIFTIEVKFDLYCVKTGNIAIEYHNCKKDCPSGIYTTQADIWVHLVTTKDGRVEAYAIQVKKLRYIVENLTPLRSTTKSGDNNSNLKLYKKESIISNFTRIDTIEDANILKNKIQEIL